MKLQDIPEYVGYEYCNIYNDDKIRLKFIFDAWAITTTTSPVVLNDAIPGQVELAQRIIYTSFINDVLERYGKYDFVRDAIKDWLEETRDDE